MKRIKWIDTVSYGEVMWIGYITEEKESKCASGHSGTGKEKRKIENKVDIEREGFIRTKEETGDNSGE